MRACSLISNLFRRVCLFITFLVLVVVLISLTPPSAHGQLTLKDFKLPIPYEQTNAPGKRIDRYKSLVVGQEVVSVSNGLYYVLGMRIENYQLDGKTNLIARAPECLLDTESKTVWSTNRLEVESPNGLYIEGIGFLCYLTNFNLIISNQVRTYVGQQLLQSNAAIAGVITATNQLAQTNVAMTVFADHFALDYASNLITYTGNVHLEHTQIHLSSDSLKVQRATNGALQRVLATQNVTILNKLDNSVATGDVALYTPGPPELIQLSGHAEWKDDQRRSRADLFLFEPRAKHLRAQGHAWMSLPRQSVGQPDLWAGKPATNQVKAAPSATLTNATVEISAEVLDLQMPTTNQPSRLMIADRSVVIVSPADKSRATAERAVFDESTGMLELAGDAMWQAGDRVARAQALQYDRTNRIFMAHRDAYLKVPVAELASQGARGTNALKSLQAKSNSPPQFIEMYADDYTYTSNFVVFRENVRGTLLETNERRGAISCAFLGLRFSNQLETAIASGKVIIEQFPFINGSSNRVARKLQCEQLHVRMAPGGTVERIVGLTNVVAEQDEWRKGTNTPIHSRFTSDTVTADFFPRTNQVREAIAEANVRILHDQRSAQGDRAVYTGTNNWVELTGHPSVKSPEGEITNADVLIWDRTQDKFFGKNVAGTGVGPPLKGSNQSLPFPQRTK